MSEFTQYPDWWEALGGIIPAGNRDHAYTLVRGWGLSREDGWTLIEQVSRCIERDHPNEALELARNYLKRDEISVIRLMAELCCPPVAQV
jgi:hypothetical protein